MTPQETLQALVKHGITIYRVYKDTGINEQTLRNWASGKTRPFASNGFVKVLADYADKILKTEK